MKAPVEDMPSASTSNKRQNEDSLTNDVEPKRPKLEEPYCFFQLYSTSILIVYVNSFSEFGINFPKCLYIHSYLYAKYCTALFSGEKSVSQSSGSAPPEGLNEETVRRYLRRQVFSSLGSF